MPALNEGVVPGAVAVICDQGTTNMRKTGQCGEMMKEKKSNLGL